MIQTLQIIYFWCLTIPSQTKQYQNYAIGQALIMGISSLFWECKINLKMQFTSQYYGTPLKVLVVLTML